MSDFGVADRVDSDRTPALARLRAPSPAQVEAGEARGPEVHAPRGYSNAAGFTACSGSVAACLAEQLAAQQGQKRVQISAPEPSGLIFFCQLEKF